MMGRSPASFPSFFPLFLSVEEKRLAGAVPIPSVTLSLSERSFVLHVFKRKTRGPPPFPPFFLDGKKGNEDFPFSFFLKDHLLTSTDRFSPVLFACCGTPFSSFSPLPEGRGTDPSPLFF